MKRTRIMLVQDETGSMLNRQEVTRSAFNEYFKTLKEAPEDLGDVLVNVFQFSEAPNEERVRLFYEGELMKVPELTGKNYRPRGVTPLLDAVGTAIQTADRADDADRYLLIVQTDGLENASREFTWEQVAAMIQEKEAAPNWTIVFLGEGVDNWAKVAQQMGAQLNSIVGTRGSAAGTSSSYGSVAGQTVTYLSTDVLANKSMGAQAQVDVDEAEESGTS